MEHTLSKIALKMTYYKICPACNKINWYENSQCINCLEDLEEVEIVKDEAKWISIITGEYDFWINQEGYTEEEIDGIYLEV
jgi:hypothetical protein